MATDVEDAHTIAKQAKHAFLPAAAPAVPPLLVSAPIEFTSEEDPVTSTTLFSKHVDPSFLSWWSSAWLAVVGAKQEHNEPRATSLDEILSVSPSAVLPG